MSRNGLGTFSAATTFADGNPWTAAVVNAMYGDIGAEITNSLALDGQSTMTAPLKAANGTAAAPAYTFGTDTNTGWYRKAADSIGGAVGGVLLVTFDSAGITLASGAFVGALTGNVTGDLTGNVTGNLTGTVTGTASGNVLPTVTITAGTGLSGGGDLSANRSFALANTAVTPASYKAANITVDQQGRLTAASSTIPVTGQAALVTVAGASPTVTFKSSSITSITRNGTGKWDVVLSGFTSADYTVHVTGGNVAGLSLVTANPVSGQTSSGFSIQWTLTNAASNNDPGANAIVHLTIFGGV